MTFLYVTGPWSQGSSQQIPPGMIRVDGFVCLCVREPHVITVPYVPFRNVCWLPMCLVSWSGLFFLSLWSFFLPFSPCFFLYTCFSLHGSHLQEEEVEKFGVSLLVTMLPTATYYFHSTHSHYFLTFAFRFLLPFNPLASRLMIYWTDLVFVSPLKNEMSPVLAYSSAQMEQLHCSDSGRSPLQFIRNAYSQA